MLQFIPRQLDSRLRVLAVGAHPDDVEIGAGGTLLELVRSVSGVRVDVLVLTGTPERAEESRSSAAAFLAGVERTVTVFDLPDGRLPARVGAGQEPAGGVRLDETASQPHPSVQPRRVPPGPPNCGGADPDGVSRGVLTLGYEIVKWDGDLIRRSVYVPLSAEVAERKADLLLEHFPSQHGRDWYDREVFLGLARLRGVECQSPYAEAFNCAKVTLGFAP